MPSLYSALWCGRKYVIKRHYSKCDDLRIPFVFFPTAILFLLKFSNDRILRCGPFNTTVGPVAGPACQEKRNKERKIQSSEDGVHYVTCCIRLPVVRQSTAFEIRFHFILTSLLVRRGHVPSVASNGPKTTKVADYGTWAKCRYQPRTALPPTILWIGIRRPERWAYTVTLLQ